MTTTHSTGMRFHESVLDAIGSTPLVRLGRIAPWAKATLLAKCEFVNPGGSVKDRIGQSIIEEAERSGRLAPGGTIVEGTSGNTGIGLAMAAAIKGYRAILVMPDKMSREKIAVLESLGAEVVITPTNVDHDDPRSYASVAKRIVAETPGAVFADQFENPVNPLTHYRTTGPEIWRDTDGKITHMVVCLGTGGTISGIGRYLKEQNPAVKIIGVDPVGSVYHASYYKSPPQTSSYFLEGMGEDQVPKNMDFGVIDEVVQVNDKESFLAARQLSRKEGMFCGGTAGAALVAALRVVEGCGPSDVVVTLLPDGGARYMNKLYSDDWMKQHGFLA
ncbi:MAG: cysteine synthase family protein [Pseudomonadota bacterium]